MTYEVAESTGIKGEWRVEAIRHDGDGEVYVTLFSGLNAEERAREYAQWKKATL